MHSIGRTQNFNMLNKLAHIVTTGLFEVEPVEQHTKLNTTWVSTCLTSVTAFSVRNDSTNFQVWFWPVICVVSWTSWKYSIKKILLLLIFLFAFDVTPEVRICIRRLFMLCVFLCWWHTPAYVSSRCCNVFLRSPASSCHNLLLLTDEPVWLMESHIML